LIYNGGKSEDDTYKYWGNSYGLSFSLNRLDGAWSYDLFLIRHGVSRQCLGCDIQNMTLYEWGFSAQNNWMWDWGLYIYFGLGFSFEYKTYDYRGSSFIGPQLHL